MTRNEYLQQACIAAIGCPVEFYGGVTKWVEEHVAKLEKLEGFRWDDEIIQGYEDKINEQREYIDKLMAEISRLRVGE